MKPKPLDELEMYELICAAYPEKFPDDDDEDARWEMVQEFASEISGWEEVADLLGRVALLTMPMTGGLSGRLAHCLGVVTVNDDGVAKMTAVVKRDIA